MRLRMHLGEAGVAVEIDVAVVLEQGDGGGVQALPVDSHGSSSFLGIVQTRKSGPASSDPQLLLDR